MSCHYVSSNPEDDSTHVRVAMRWPQPSMCPVPRSTCTQHVTLCTKREFLLISDRIFTMKMWGKSRFNLPDGYLWLWSFVPWSQKWIRLSKSYYFSFKTPSFPQFSMAVALCYNGWNLNSSRLRNARRAGLETSSGSNHSYSIIIVQLCRPKDKRRLVTMVLMLFFYSLVCYRKYAQLI